VSNSSKDKLPARKNGGHRGLIIFGLGFITPLLWLICQIITQLWFFVGKKICT